MKILYTGKNYGKVFQQAVWIVEQASKLLPTKIQIVVTTSEAQVFFNKAHKLETMKEVIFDECMDIEMMTNPNLESKLRKWSEGK